MGLFYMNIYALQQCRIYFIKVRYHILKLLNRNEFIITETELKLIAAAAIMGDNNIPKTGYKTPAATEIPNTL